MTGDALSWIVDLFVNPSWFQIFIIILHHICSSLHKLPPSTLHRQNHLNPYLLWLVQIYIFFYTHLFLNFCKIWKHSCFKSILKGGGDFAMDVRKEIGDYNLENTTRYLAV